MTIVYEPSNVARRMATKKMLSQVITRDLTINKAVIKRIAQTGVVTEPTLERVALRVLKEYKESIRLRVKDGLSYARALRESLGNKQLLVQRIDNLIRYEIKEEIKEQYGGSKYVWLPSDAKEPDPRHQLRYGKTYRIGKGEMPQDRYGCRCGMKILVEESRLKL